MIHEKFFKTSQNRRHLTCNSYTDYLFVQPSFMEGVGRVFDFSNALDQFNYSENSDVADSIAIYNDWRTVGWDIQLATEEYWLNTPELHEQEKQEEKEKQVKSRELATK